MRTRRASAAHLQARLRELNALSAQQQLHVDTLQSQLSSAQGDYQKQLRLANEVRRGEEAKSKRAVAQGDAPRCDLRRVSRRRFCRASASSRPCATSCTA